MSFKCEYTENPNFRIFDVEKSNLKKKLPKYAVVPNTVINSKIVQKLLKKTISDAAVTAVAVRVAFNYQFVGWLRERGRGGSMG